MLGVDKRQQGRNIGTRLLWRIVRQILRVATPKMINCLFLTALNQKAKDWYLNSDLDFREAAPDSMLLVLSVETMRVALSPESFVQAPEDF